MMDFTGSEVITAVSGRAHLTTQRQGSHGDAEAFLQLRIFSFTSRESKSDVPARQKHSCRSAHLSSFAGSYRDSMRGSAAVAGAPCLSVPRSVPLASRKNERRPVLP